MTNILNRRTGLIALEEELAAQKEKNSDLSICFIDLDELKNVNDAYGHLEGDSMIKTIVKTFRVLIGEKDLILRLGGDEFLIILPDSDYPNSEQLIKNVETELAKEDTLNKKKYKHSFSYGIVDVKMDGIYDSNEIIRRADEKMYIQKANKKN